MKHDRNEEVIQRLLAGEDPTKLERELGDPGAIAAATRALEWLALANEPVSPSRGLREAILGATRPEAALTGFAHRAANFFQIDAAKAHALLASVQQVDAEPWFDDQVEGVRMRPVDAGSAIANATCLLVHLQPGVAYPTHRHLGDEWCLFLQGSAREGEREWNPGDLVLNPSGSQHPVLEAVSSEPFVFGVVLYEGLEFTPA